MSKEPRRLSQGTAWFVLALLTAAILAACGGSQPAPAEDISPTTAATSAPEEAEAEDAGSEEAEAEGTDEAPAEDAQAESPLAQPESPLTQQESPLTTAATAPRTEDEAIALAEITTAAEPGEGNGTIAGVVYSFGTVPGAIRGTQVFLEAAIEQDGEFIPPPVSLGPSVEDGDIIVETSDLGQLHMEVPPGNYYAAVWTLYDWRLVVSAAGEEAPRLITIEEGDQLDLGVLYVYWP